MQGSEILGIANSIQEELAGGSLTRTFARLYSQHTKLRLRQPGLASWTSAEAMHRFEDAMRLVDVSLVQKQSGIEHWQPAMRRAGELLEWLSHPSINENGLPFHFLSAAAYQIAGYPARATGLLAQTSLRDNESEILSYFFKADFANLLSSLRTYWALNVSQHTATTHQFDWANIHDSEQFSNLLTAEIASALGVLCMAMRWGNSARQQRAIDKLSALGKLYLYGTDSYSWLLSKLSAETAKTYIASALRRHVNLLSESVNEVGREALERYIRLSFRFSKPLAWPSQITGIQRLATKESFALCTPTGSGKTTVAELAILQSLFGNSDPHTQNGHVAPLSIYFVPSKALAAEVEAKLSRIISRLVESPPIVVTGLYGGIDWGPTDAWLTSDDPTVLICTYEKGEALIRFLGPLFLRRVSQVIIDEAHSVQFGGNNDELRTAQNRSLRLESLGARLFHYLEGRQSRVVALSAVASGFQHALANWVSNQPDALPVTEAYHSTRQLIGRLECRPQRQFRIRYDLLDGHDLSFDADDEENIPYVTNPFPAHPPIPQGKFEGSMKQLRPYLLWAALNFAAADDRLPVRPNLEVNPRLR
jgi:hypothetical protein